MYETSTIMYACTIAIGLGVSGLVAVSAIGPGGGDNAPSVWPVPAADIPNFDTFVVRSPPKSLGLDPFYAKYADAAGIPVIGSEKVPDTALLIARDIVLYMLSERVDVRDAMIRAGARVGIMATDESTTDIPEQRDWKKPAPDDPRLTPDERRNYAETIGKMTDREYWAKRARGMGGLYTTGAVENLMGVPGTPYYGGNILVHEFSHNVFNTLRTVDPEIVARVEQAYTHAYQKGLWVCSYMEHNVDEYWAEGTRFWFNTNLAYRRDDTTVATSDDFKAHDPELYDIMAEVYRHDHHILADAFYQHPAQLQVRPIDPEHNC
ncbi:glycoside hydrolase [Sinorhizobium sp. 7-81]|uniref:glycoside hydrolase n=1 Tax=unclassified Sinorhizobium TaxID=2613772 RepID=UPI0024C45136|nr:MULTISPECIES: glycoside hydrolase [unclassified Sinorhizobium]MDK1389297.1 glycoside hydrolase [Sinorhizobium sp. 7-81]MDK1493577.1 glycoside hydrolase [Sinorhizobium sp. 8-89]